MSYTPRFLVKVHCTFARSFNEHPNSLSLRILICNTFIEGHPNDLLPLLSPEFFLYSILGQQLLFKRKHRRVPIHGHMYGKLCLLKLKCWLSDGKKVQDCDYVFGSSTTFQRRKEWICESRCRQVSVRLHVFAGFFGP